VNSAAPSTGTATGNTSTTGTVTLPTTTFEGITTSVELPQASSVVTITEIVSTGVPNGTPPLSVARAAQAKRGPLDATQTTLFYVELLPSASVTIFGTPGLNFTFPSIAAGTTFYLAAYESVAGTFAWVAPAEGPGNVTGTTVSFPLTTGAITITPTVPLLVALYSVAAGSTPGPIASNSPLPVASPPPTASPSPAPHASASASPGASATPSPSAAPTATPLPSVAPATLTFDANAPTTAPFTVTETGDTAAFTATIACAPAPSPSPSGSPSPAPAPFVAELGAASATPTGGVAMFSVTSGNEPGICTIVVTDAHGATATETVDVDAVSLGLFATHRKIR
jgi:hypothetical protein